ncbi:uncharacterized protein LOC143041433 [Oratosquilla oratoria]|uniref:uncharacterized protein LOC143041433 n=1 Tax=Oratosquilla oratoria TaxID=337810 RepID=UPI003F762302
MAGRRVFQGQIGMNETPLTVAIENGDFKQAEKIILSTSDPQYLNDGPYENIPLHMVLTNNHHSDHCRNLNLARLLVEHGANPNLRIPYGDIDRASPSPFEELLVYYELLKSYVKGDVDILCEVLEIFLESDEDKLEFITNTISLTGEECKPTMDDCLKLIEETSELIDVFLDYGSDPSITTTFSNKTLFHWVAEHEDTELAKRLLATSRVKLNICDAHGNSPLMDIIFRNDPRVSLELYEAMSDGTDALDLNHYNCCGETTFFRAVFVGATALACRLKDDGANIQCNIFLCVSGPPPANHSCQRAALQEVSSLTSALFAPLLASSPLRLRYFQVFSNPTAADECHMHKLPPHKHLVEKIIATAISPLVDQGCLNTVNVAAEVVSHLFYTNFPHLRETSDLVPLMFGQCSAGLRQLCVRTIFDSIFVSNASKKLPPDLALCDLCTKFCKNSLTPDHVKEIVELLRLPNSLAIFFEIETAKHQICKHITGLENLCCDQACSESDESLFEDDDGDDDETFYTSEGSSYYADSMLFFSSDMLDSSDADDMSNTDFSDSDEEEEEEEGGEEEEEEDEEEECSRSGNSEADDAKQESRSCQKNSRRNSCDYDTVSSESEEIRDIVEFLYEDIADIPPCYTSDCCTDYQKLENLRVSSSDSQDETRNNAAPQEEEQSEESASHSDSQKSVREGSE